MLITLLVSAAFAAAPLKTEAMLVRLESMRVDPAELAPYVGDSNPDVRARTAVSLGRMRNTSTLGSLSTLLADDHVNVRIAAANALGQTAGSRVIIQRRLAIEPNKHVRTSLLNALGMQGSAWDIDKLLEIVQLPINEDHTHEDE